MIAAESEKVIYEKSGLSLLTIIIGLGIVIIHNRACTFANVTWDMSSA